MCYIKNNALTSEHRKTTHMWKVFGIGVEEPRLRAYFVPGVTFTPGQIATAVQAEHEPGPDDCHYVESGVFHGFLTEEDAKHAMAEWIDQTRPPPRCEYVLLRVEIVEFHSAGRVPKRFFGQGLVSIGATKIRIPESAE